jgi:hypothetical protein
MFHDGVLRFGGVKIVGLSGDLNVTAMGALQDIQADWHNEVNSRRCFSCGIAAPAPKAILPAEAGLHLRYCDIFATAKS